MIATNPGEPLRPMEHIASGGELSRVMLALKASVEAASGKKREFREPQRTLVFDEIDTGIGGRAAEAVGKKLKSSVPLEPGPLRHPSAPDRHLRRPSLPDREEGRRPAAPGPASTSSPGKSAPRKWPAC